MKIAIASIVGESPYSSSKHYDPSVVPAKPKENKNDYEERTWRNRLHVSEDGHVVIPGACFLLTVLNAVRRLKIQIPGKGKTEYTKYFEGGVMCVDDLKLAIKAEDVKCERLFVPADGKPGGGKRVYRNFPVIPAEAWYGDVVFYILDDIITEDIFQKVLISAGMLVGIGRFRPQNRGFYGRFSVKQLVWKDDVSLSTIGSKL